MVLMRAEGNTARRELNGQTRRPAETRFTWRHYLSLAPAVYTRCANQLIMKLIL